MQAHEEAVGLQRDARQLVQLAQTMREATAGDVLLLRCAWCDAFQFGSEWLRFEAIGHGQHRITSELRAKSSHGICPDCFVVEMGRLKASRARWVPAGEEGAGQSQRD
jgi:hypothetical protein